MERNYDVLVAASRSGKKPTGIICVQFALVNNINVQFMYRVIPR